MQKINFILFSENEALTKKCAKLESEIDILKQVTEKKTLSYIRREDKMKAEIEELKIQLEKVLLLF